MFWLGFILGVCAGAALLGLYSCAAINKEENDK